jgi:hypothetical protein
VRPKRLCQGINSNDTIGNRTRDVPVCSVVPQPTTPPRAPIRMGTRDKSKDTAINTYLTSAVMLTVICASKCVFCILFVGNE